MGDMCESAAARLRDYADAIDDIAPDIAKAIRIVLAERGGHIRGAEMIVEQGRRLANRRDDLIAAGADPASLAVPLAPSPAVGGPKEDA